MIDHVLILGGGSAGFLAAITLKTKIPRLRVSVIHSKEIGVIGVGEATTADVPRHLHEYLRVDAAEFFRVARPMWKLAIRFLWGRRPFFDYIFGHQLHSRYAALPKHTGYYCAEEFDDCGLVTAMLTRDRAFPRREDGLPEIGRSFGYHLENVTFVAYLEMLALRAGVEIHEGKVAGVRQGEMGIAGLTLEDGRAFEGDLYLDCSGFRSLLLGKTLAEPYISFTPSLYCDRAVTGGWARRSSEPIQAYTTAETMNNGWCWRIDHEETIHRGYVYSSSFVTDADAEAEFREKNPAVTDTRLVRYVTGRYERAWVKNVVAIGNSGGFVEPLESTGLAAICTSSQNLAEMLLDCDGHVRPTMVNLHNNRAAAGWDAIRQFLAVHYKFNRRLDTRFWQDCREKADLAGAENVVEFYREHGPTPIGFPTLVNRADQFGAEGYMSLLLGMQVPFETSHVITEAERATWARIKQLNIQRAQTAWPAGQVLELFRTRGWDWGSYFK